MILIGLTGYARAGKDTVADYLVAEHGFTKLSFAAPLKRMLRTLDPYVTQSGAKDPMRASELWEALDGDEDAIKTSAYGLEYRRLLQTLGTDCLRAIDPDFWVKAMVQELQESGADRVVLPDTRFPNEAELIHEPVEYGMLGSNGARNAVIRVSRPGVTAVNSHESEKWVGRMGEDATIYNDGTRIDHLHQSTEEVLIGLGVL